jgi:hypothetical protein
MMLERLVEDSAWLFDFGFPLRRVEPNGNPRSPDGWRLSEVHQLPGLNRLSQSERQHQARMGWDDTGIYLELDIPMGKRQDSWRLQGETIVHFFIDTRSSPGIHRGNANCHQFDFQMLSKLDDTVDRSRMDSRLVKLTRAIAHPNPVDDDDLHGWFSASADLVQTKVFIGQAALTGFNPREFNEIGVYYFLIDPQYRRFSMARLSHAIPWEDPSLWSRARLVD